MNVLIVSAIYPPEPVVSAQTSAQIAIALRATGHAVRVVTNFPNRPAGKLFPGVRRKFAQRESTPDGIEIVRCFSTLSPESTIRSRMAENLSFGLTSGWQVLTGSKPDVIYANTWPIVATGILYLIAWLRRIPVVLSVQDVYPEVLIVQQRTMENSRLARLMRWIDGVIARRSAHVVVISQRFAEIYRQQRRVPPDRLSLIPNWIDGSQIDVGVDGSAYRQKLGIDETDFLLVYGGNVGVAAGVEVVIEALRLLGDERALRLVVAGAGSQLAKCQQLAATLPGNPVHFHTPWMASETTEVLRAADLLVLPTQREQSLASVPSKLLSYMLAGRPILAAATPDSDLAELIIHAECGWVIEPDRPDLWANQLKQIMALDPVVRHRCGENGRTYVLQHFTRAVCLGRMLTILESIR
jgi:colanic acid biosynthesis glycosyl transferase WcaI